MAAKYGFWLDNVYLPIPPSSLTIQTPNRNETIELIDGSELNILKEPGLKQIQFECIIPQVSYPFASYGSDEFIRAKVYLDKFELLKQTKKSFLFAVFRHAFDSYKAKPYKNRSFKTVLDVSLEDYIQIDDAESGTDIRLAITLKEYREYGTKTFKIKEKVIVPDPPPRPVEPPPIPPPPVRIYTVKSGDSLWAICARELGNGGLCWEVAKRNNIPNPNVISVGQRINLSGF